MVLAYSFRGLVHYQYGRKHGGTQTDMRLEKKLSVLHLDLREERRDRHEVLLEETSKPTPVTYFLVQTTPNPQVKPLPND